MTEDRARAIRIAQRWLQRADLNPTGELALVAREFIEAVTIEQFVEDAADVGVVELPPWPYH